MAKFHGHKCPSPVAIAQVQAEELRKIVLDMDDDSIDAFVQVGTNLSMVSLCMEMEEKLDKPFIAINSATYWHALRAMGINDQFNGHGPLFERH